jgi:DHA1 family bicyclomycin/chloramphenicol resistance-like MFS transporter
MFGRSPAAPPSLLAVGAVLTALVAVGQVSTSIYIPSMPSLVRALDTSPAAINLTLTLFLAGFACGQLAFGPLSDRWGRKPVLLAGLALYLAASLACALAASIEVLIAARLVQGLAASAGPVLGRAMVRDLFDPSRAAQALGYIGAAFSISPAISPLIGGYLQVWFGWRAAFVFLVVFAVALIAACHGLLRETRPPPALSTGETGQDGHRGRSPPAPRAAYWIGCRSVAAARGFWAHALAVALSFGALMAFTAAGPFVLIEVLGLSPNRFGLLYVFPVAGFFVGSIAAGRLATAATATPLLVGGLLLATIGGFAMTALALFSGTTVAGVLAPMVAFSAGLGLVMATGTAGALAGFPQVAGAASALLGFVQIAAGGLASFAVGRMDHGTAVPVAVTIAALSSAALASFLMLRAGSAPRRR